jgi:transcriptional regulator with XRE-family HTH domain/tetratricopeptide (TPR) repeat protein
VDDQPVGRRVALLRTQRRMSQQMFADRLGKSKSWVDKVERGVRRLDKFSTIAEIANVLNVDVAVLMDGGGSGVGTGLPNRPRGPRSGSGVDVAEIRAALERYDKIGVSAGRVTTAVSLPEVRKSVDHAWMAFQHANYVALVKMLPKLIRDAQTVGTTGEGDAARCGAYLLAEAYQIASSTLRKLGEHDLAWLAADRATMICLRAGDDLLSALATDRVAAALCALGRVRSAMEISVTVANQVAPQDDHEATAQRQSVYGTVLLRAALAAARLGDALTVRELLAAAETVAKEVGDDNLYWTCFGPTNVALVQVAAEVELGEAARALRTSDGIDPSGYAAMLPERRASHLLNVARAHTQLGDLLRASEALVEADRLAPNEVRCRPIAQELVVELIRRAGGPPTPGMVEIVDHIGLSAAPGTSRS